VVATIRLHATRGWNLLFFAQRRKTSNKALQDIHRKVLEYAINIFLANIHLEGVLASLQRLHPDPKEVSSDLNT
jgi:AraC-like DNA-binding protein